MNKMDMDTGTSLGGPASWRSSGRLALLVLWVIVSANAVKAVDWSQFRGHNGSGRTDERDPLPEKIGVEKNLKWKRAIPDGISSPVVGGGCVFVTTADGTQLGTMALDVETGEMLWHAQATTVRKASGKRLATTSVVTDGELVISFFGASGLLCYDLKGGLQWQKDLGPIKNQFNHAASPILVGDRLIQVVDHDGQSFVVALNKKTGKELWRNDRFVFGRNYASPLVWEFDGRRFVVVAGSGLVTGYDLETGEPGWYVRATAAVVNPTPVLSGDQRMLFVHSQSPASGAKSTPFRSLRDRFDQDGNGQLNREELPNSFLKTFFSKFDHDKSGSVDEQEYASFEQIARPFVKGMVAIRAGGNGDLTETNIAWSQSRSMPRTPSAIWYEGMLFVVNESGVLQSFDSETGELIHKGRIAARGTVYSSPALGDGKIYVGTRDGQVAVMSAAGDWKNLHMAELGDEIQASPAIARGAIFYRTKKTLYCFARDPEP